MVEITDATLEGKWAAIVKKVAKGGGASVAAELGALKAETVEFLGGDGGTKAQSDQIVDLTAKLEEGQEALEKVMEENKTLKERVENLEGALEQQVTKANEADARASELEKVSGELVAKVAELEEELGEDPEEEDEDDG